MDSGRAARLDPTLVELLRASGLRATRPRVAVLDYFRSERGHHSADEVVSALRAGALQLPRASVFGIVDALSAAGLLRIALTGPGRTLYEWADEPHHHFVCRVCGMVFDVQSDLHEQLRLTRSDLPGEVEEAQLIFRGVCRSCQ